MTDSRDDQSGATPEAGWSPEEFARHLGWDTSHHSTPQQGGYEFALEAVLPEPHPNPPLYIQRIIAREAGVGDDRSGMTNELVWACAEAGYTNGQILDALMRHQPTVDKRGGEDTPDFDNEFVRMIEKVRAVHPHPGRWCIHAGCPDTPDWQEGRRHERHTSAHVVTSEAARGPSSLSLNGWGRVDLAPALDGEWSEGPSAEILRRSDGRALLYPEEINTLFGPPGTLKTWLALLAVCQVLEAGRSAVFVDLEGSERSTAARLLALGVSRERILERFVYVRSELPYDSTAEAALHQLVSDHDAALVVIDSMTELMAGLGHSPDVGTDVANVHQRIRPLTRGGAALLVIDHIIKNTHDRRVLAPIGSERKLAGIGGAGLGVELVSEFGVGRTGRANVVRAKDRHGHVSGMENPQQVVAVLVLHSDEATGEISAELEVPEEHAGDRLQGSLEHISQVLERVAPDGLNKTRLKELVGLADTVVDRGINRLDRAGYIKVTQVGTSKMHKSIRPYRQGDPLNGTPGDDPVSP